LYKQTQTEKKKEKSELILPFSLNMV